MAGASLSLYRMKPADAVVWANTAIAKFRNVVLGGHSSGWLTVRQCLVLAKAPLSLVCVFVQVPVCGARLVSRCGSMSQNGRRL